jgi:hypothetical protein
MEEKSIVFENILKLVKEKFNNDIFEQIKTRNGNTQYAEGSYKLLIKNILIENGYEFKEAGSQQPYDFRILLSNNETLYLELKKTDGYRICFNDTYPNSEAYYIIIYTAKKSVTYDPQIVGVNGIRFIENCPWIEEYMKDINIIKQKFSNREGNMFVYPRPNLSSDIKFLLTKSSKEKEKKIKIKKTKGVKSYIENKTKPDTKSEEKDDMIELNEIECELECEVECEVEYEVECEVECEVEYEVECEVENEVEYEVEHEIIIS